MMMFSDDADNAMTDSSDSDLTDLATSLIGAAGSVATAALTRPGTTIIQQAPAAVSSGSSAAAVAAKSQNQMMFLMMLGVGGFLLYNATKK
jgi:hypothetical protein